MKLLHKGAVHQHIQQGEEFIRHLAPAPGGRFPGEHLPSEAGVAPDGFSGQFLPHPAEEGHQPPLVFSLPRLAPQEGEAVYKVGLQFLNDVVLHLFGEGVPVIEVPGLGLEAVFAVVPAAGHEQGYPDPHPVGNVPGLDVTVVHKKTSQSKKHY